MADPTYADLIFARIAALSGCVCEKVQAIEGTCFCGIVPGANYVSMSGYGDCEDEDEDKPGCGEVWVRMAGAYPSLAVGVATVDPNLSCNTSLGLDLEVGVLRCIPIPEDGEAPSADDLMKASFLQVQDMVAMREAIVCCDHFPSVVLGRYTPVGIDGGLVGGSWTLSVGMD